MKKILLLEASPRKAGNSDLLCDQFAKGAESSGHTVEKVYINDLPSVLRLPTYRQLLSKR